MKNEINTDQLSIKTGSRRNGWRNFFPVSITGSHKYENGREKVENETGQNKKKFVRFQPYQRESEL